MRPNLIPADSVPLSFYSRRPGPHAARKKGFYQEASPIQKAEAKIGQWRKEIAPNTAFRKWFAHDPARWLEFKRRYFAELDSLDEPFNSFTETVIISQRRGEVMRWPSLIGKRQIA